MRIASSRLLRRVHRTVERDDRRCQEAGVTADAIPSGTRDRERRDVPCEIVLDEREAIRHALVAATPGEPHPSPVTRQR